MNAAKKKQQQQPEPKQSAEPKGESKIVWEPIVVKVQRPIATVGHASEYKGVEVVLIYNESRSIEQMWPMTPSLAALFKKDVYKVYCQARYNPRSGYISIDGLTSEQKW